MTLSRLLAVLVVLTLFPTAAEARTTIIEPQQSQHPYQRWVDEAYVPTPTVTLSVIELEDPCLSVIAYSCTDELSKIELEINFEEDNWFFFHELGHVFDRLVVAERQRVRFGRIMKLPSLPWRGYAPIEGSSVIQQGLVEWFADVYALCAIRERFPKGTEYELPAGPRSATVIRRACGMIRAN